MIKMQQTTKRETSVKKSTINILLNDERLNALSLRSERTEGYLLSHTTSALYRKFPPSAIRQTNNKQNQQQHTN